MFAYANSPVVLRPLRLIRQRFVRGAQLLEGFGGLALGLGGPARLVGMAIHRSAAVGAADFGGRR